MLLDRSERERSLDALFVNAISSIEMGVQDSEAAAPARELSAVRNLHAGLFLLAKWLLVKRAPNAHESDVLAMRYEPKLDDNGAVIYKPVGEQTIGLQDIKRRFKSFGLSLSDSAVKALNDLARVRNDVEHLCPRSEGSLRESVSRSYLVAAELFRLGGLDPAGCFLSDAWSVMLRHREVYEHELSACRETFKDVIWGFPGSRCPSLQCLGCSSDLIERVPLEAQSPDRVPATCRACGQNMVVPTGFRHLFLEDGRLAVLTSCPSCLHDTYIKELRDDAYVTACVDCDFESTHALPSDMLVSVDELLADDLDPFTYFGGRVHPRP